MSTLNLDNFQFNEYTKQAMLAYFELEDETGIEDILIEKIKNDAEAKIKIICNNMQLS
jgi:hypothetical protein